ncbi:AraC family transcriptional regulator [Vibrio nomapromontoriensis]|uniref:AraC family transcriptional regulator n=1 Tax=Vibrio nomapromontoriensis TaxID=2910246 RepID=UPI003D13D776
MPKSESKLNSQVSARPMFVRSAYFPMEMRVSTDSSACYQKHTHQEFSVGVVDDGRSTFTINNREISISSGSTVIVNPLEVHACNPKSCDSWSYKMLFVCPTWLASLQAKLNGSDGKDFVPLAQPHLTDKVVFSQFQSLAEMLLNEDSKEALEQESIAFFAELFQRSGVQVIHEKNVKAKLTKALRFIQSRYDKSVSVREMAEHVGLSEYYFIHAFRSEYGLTPYAMQMVSRVNEAKLRLKQGQSIAHVAIDLGFSDQSHFHRNFKKIVAATPLDYVANVYKQVS